MKKFTVLLFTTIFLLPVDSSAQQVQKISAGGYHSLALCSDGRVSAWGRNIYGQLGDGTQTSSLIPVQVHGPDNVGFLTNIIALTAGSEGHSMALKDNGTVWTWGNNEYGQLGDGTTTNRNTPAQVSGLSGIVAISGGYYCSFALKNDGTLWAWGANWFGMLGDGTTTDRLSPVQVHGPNNTGFLTGVAAILDGGIYHTLAVKTDGTIWAWGSNASGKLGDGTTTDRLSPIQVHGPGNIGFLTGITAVSADFSSSLALKNDGTVWAWGGNWFGSFGDGTITDSTTPVQVHGTGNVGFLTGITAIAAAYAHAFALKNDGTVWAWGQNTWIGYLGDGTTTNRLTPVQVSGLSGITAISGGRTHTFALKNDETTWGWGINWQGELGDGTDIEKSPPVQLYDRCFAPECNLLVDAGPDKYVYFNSGNSGPSTNQLPHCRVLTAVPANNTGTPGYLWSPTGQTTSQITVCPTITTTYTVTATENPCTATDEVTVSAIDIGGDLSPYQVGNNPNKVYVCCTLTNTTEQANVNANCSSQNSLCFHLNHGDVLGQCGQLRPARNLDFSGTSFNVFPNPFSEHSTIRFTMEQNTHVILDVFDMAGRKVCTLFNDSAEKGQPYEITFDGTNQAEGIFIYKASTNEGNYTGKILLMKK